MYTYVYMYYILILFEVFGINNGNDLYYLGGRSSVRSFRTPWEEPYKNLSISCSLMFSLVNIILGQ